MISMVEYSFFLQEYDFIDMDTQWSIKIKISRGEIPIKKLIKLVGNFKQVHYGMMVNEISNCT